MPPSLISPARCFSTKASLQPISSAASTLSPTFTATEIFLQISRWVAIIAGSTATASAASASAHPGAAFDDDALRSQARESQDDVQRSLQLHRAPSAPDLSATVIFCSPAKLRPSGTPSHTWRRFCFSILAPSDPRLRQHVPSSSPPHSASVPSLDTYTRPPSLSPDFTRFQITCHPPLRTLASATY